MNIRKKKKIIKIITCDQSDVNQVALQGGPMHNLLVPGIISAQLDCFTTFKDPRNLETQTTSLVSTPMSHDDEH